MTSRYLFRLTSCLLPLIAGSAARAEDGRKLTETLNAALAKHDVPAMVLPSSSVVVCWPLMRLEFASVVRRLS